MTLVPHDSGIPLGSVSYHEEGGEIGAVQQLLGEVDIQGRVITVDALHSTHETISVIVDEQRADYLMTLKDNTPKQLDKLKSLNWRSSKVRRFSEPPAKAHGRYEQRHIEVLSVSEGAFDFRHVKQAFRIRRDRELVKDPDSASSELAFGITSVSERCADAQQLLAWNRGHWSIENGNHYVRDCTFGEDDCRARTKNAPDNNALCGNIALALIRHRGGFRTVPEAVRHYSLHRKDAFDALLSPT